MKTEKILVAHVTLCDLTITVAANQIEAAIFDLNGHPQPGSEIKPIIKYAEMSKTEFQAIPELV